MTTSRERFTFPQGMRVSPDGSGRGFYLDFDPTRGADLASLLESMAGAIRGKYALPAGVEGISTQPGATSVLPHVAKQPVTQQQQPQSAFNPLLAMPPSVGNSLVGLGPNQPAIKAPPPPGAEMNPGAFPQGGGAPAAIPGVAVMPQPGQLKPPPAMFPAAQAAQAASQAPQYYSAPLPGQAPLAPQAQQASPVPAAQAPVPAAKSVTSPAKGAVIGRIGPASPAQLAEAKRQREAAAALEAAAKSVAESLAPAQTQAPQPPQVAQAAPGGFVSLPNPVAQPTQSGAFLPVEVVHETQRARNEPLAAIDGAHVPIVGPSQSSANGLEIVMGKDEKGNVVGVGGKRTGPIQKLPQPPIAAPPAIPPPPPSRLVDAQGRRLSG